MRACITGATGVLGRNVAARLIERGHTVQAVVRDPRSGAARGLAQLGASVLAGDILDHASLVAALRGCDVALHLATALRHAFATGDWSVQDRVRRDGAATLIDACASAGVARYVQQSIAWISGDGSAWVDEASPVDTTGRLQSAADMERVVRESPLRWQILRGGAFYGPGTGQPEGWRAQAQAGTLAWQGGGEGGDEGADFVSLIHVADMADAVVRACESDCASVILNIVDDQPVTWRELFEYVAAGVAAPPPTAGGPVRQPSFRARNELARRLLGWRPHYASYRSGLA
jgi:nucleoside-diphosphate-sugar epimerase